MTAPKGEPTPKRPSLARKHTPRTEAKRTAAHEQGIRVTYDGQEYVVRSGDLNAMDARDLRKELGLSFMGLRRGLAEDPDLDLIAALIWLARRVDGERGLPYAAVALEMGYDDAADDLEIELVTDAEPENVSDSPEG